VARSCFHFALAVATFACLLSLGVSLPLAAQNPKATPNFAEVVAKANAARDADRLDEAVSLYRQAVAMKPTWAEGWWSLGTLNYDRNDYKDAATAFEKLVALQPKSGTGRVMLGLCQVELGQDDAALESLTEGQRLGVTSEPQLRPVVMYQQGILLQRKGRFEAAEEVLGQLCHETPYPSEVALAVGAISLRVKDRQLPVTGTVENTVMRQTGDAACLGIQRRYEEGSRAFEALIAEYPKQPNLHFAYGKLLLEANDSEGAVKQFQAEIQNNPNDANARLRIASAKYRIDSAGGLPYAEEAVKLDPNLPLGHYLLGLLLLDTDDFARAIPELETAQKAFPDQPKVYFALASAYSRAGRLQDAASMRQKAARLTQEQAANDQTGVPGRSEIPDSAAPPKP
jgi:predicted Zn-dependent protease